MTASLRAGIVQEVKVFYGPQDFRGAQARSGVEGVGVENPSRP